MSEGAAAAAAVGAARPGSARYRRERDAFVRELRAFHEARGTHVRRAPVLNGRDVDLYRLHALVARRGGWAKVNALGGWDEMLAELALPAACVNGGVAVRQIYLRHLERWERVHGGPGLPPTAANNNDADSLAADADDDRPRRSGYGTPKARMTVALSYNHTQHNVPDHVREMNGLPPLQRLGGAMERLALSLLSPLPNEQDFALNVCTILAADSTNKLPIVSSPHIVDFLLGHTAVYNHPSLRDVIGKSYSEARHINMEWFWLEHARPSGTLELLDEERFPIQGLAMQALVSQLSLKSYLNDDGTMLPPDDKDLPIFEGHALAMLADEDGLLAHRCPGGARDLITRRIGQVVAVMRNLSFHDDNVPVLAKHQTFIRFIILCVNCSMSSIRQAGLDTLGNIAMELVIKDPATCLLSRHLLATLTASLYSEDRARALAALEVLNKLAQNESNEEVLLRCLEQKVYEQVCSYLTLHDIMLLVITLECMYALTTLGEKSCDFIVKIHGVIDTLVSLITVEAQSYGPKACILMRVVETVSGPINPNIQPQGQPQIVAPSVSSSQQNQQSQQVQPAPTVTQLVTPPPATVTAQITSAQQLAIQQPVSSLIQPNPNLTVQQQHAHQQVVQENEQFALAWLRTTWEPCSSNIRLDANELYKQYLACCTKVGRKGVISPLHFPRCVRSVFGGMVGPNPGKGPNGENMQFYMGIRQKPQAKAQQQQQQQQQSQQQQQQLLQQANIKAGPTSPILKAQLSKAEQTKTMGATTTLNQLLENPPSTPKSPPHVQVNAAGSTASSSTGATSIQQSNTTLIKHLLAHKVSPVATPQPTATTERMMQPQVTQRQNQQKMMGHVTSNPMPATTTSSTLEMDAEALISCSTITSTGVTSSNPSTKADVAEPHRPAKPDENSIKSANPMLTNLVEKKSSPPRIGGALSRPRPSTEEDDEPASKRSKPEESVSSTAANLYAALAASLEDEEEPTQTEAAAKPEQKPNAPSTVAKAKEDAKSEPESAAPPQMPTGQVIVTAPPAQPQGQIILHASTTNKPIGQQFVPPLQLIATPTGQPAGTVPHKTIIIVQSSSANGPITLTVNNAGNLDENTLNNLITQATEALSQQQSLALSQQQSNIQANSGVIQSTQGMLQSGQAIIQTNQPGIAQGILKQQIVQGQSQLVPGQQPIITQQPQPQLISTNQIITQGAQQFIVGNQQILAGNSGQLVIGNQQILVGNQHVIGGAHQIIGGGSHQQFVAVPGGQQRIIVDQQGNRQLVTTTGQNIVIANQQPMAIAQKQQEIKPVSAQASNNQANGNNNQKGGANQNTSAANSESQSTVINQNGNKIVNNNEASKIIPAAPRKIPDEPWVCQWKGCDTVFESASAVYMHACKVHCTRPESPCLWMYCDQLPRKRFSLMTHLQDRHCSADALKASLAQRRKGIVPPTPPAPAQLPPTPPSDKTDASSEGGASSGHGGYAPNAALHAIKRHAVDFLNPRELMQRAEASRNAVETPDDNEGPVTKSIRLTSALILRNIVLYSHMGRRLLRGYEPHLAGIALSSVEASRTVAQVLYDMNCM